MGDLMIVAIISAFFILVILVLYVEMAGGGSRESCAPPPTPSTSMPFQDQAQPDLSPLPSEAPNLQCPGWLLPAGVVSLVLAVLGFLASAATGGKGNLFAGLLAGVLNPLFFVGLPLGIYWLWQHAKSAQPCSPSPPTSPGESNPKLTACPDCGRHVSRLAAMCPHCGRPLAADKPVD